MQENKITKAKITWTGGNRQKKKRKVISNYKNFFCSCLASV